MPARLADIPSTVARECPVRVVSARRLANRGVVHPQRDPQVAGVGELGASRNTDLTSPVNSAPTDGEVVAVLDEDGVISIVGEVDALNDGSSGLRDTEDATATAAGDDLCDIDVGVVITVGITTVLVGKAEGSIAGACAHIVSINQIYLRVRGLLE